MKIGFACGVYDLFHAGHTRMLKECKDHCDYLIVGLNSAINLPSGKNLPIYSLDERVEILTSCKYVDEVKVYNSEEELYSLIKELKIDIRFLGQDYYDRSITGSDLNVEIYYINRDHGYSTSRVIQQVLAKHCSK